MAVSAAASPAAKPAPAIDPALASVWQGKTVTLVVGSAPGGGYDTWARLVGRFLSKHLPGNPTVVVQNMPGGVHRIATNFLYTAKPDGLTIGLVSNTIPTNQLVGEGPDEGVRYDVTKLSWLGSPSTAVQVLGVHQRAGVTEASQLANVSLKMGHVSPGSTSHSNMVVLRDVLGWKFTSIFGYDGSAAINLAIERGEVDAFINSWSSWVATKRDDLQAGVVKPLVQIGAKSTDPMLANVPTADSLFANKTASDKELLGLVELPLLWGYPFLAPPDMSPALLSTLRGAMAETFNDPELLAEATRAGLDVGAVSGEDLQQSMADYMRTPKDVVQRLDGLVKADSPS